MNNKIQNRSLHSLAAFSPKLRFGGQARWLSAFSLILMFWCLALLAPITPPTQATTMSAVQPPPCGGLWTQAATAGPGARMSTAMAYDSLRGRTILYGGGPPGPLSDMWAWNGSVWTQINYVGTGPGVRQQFSMVYDSFRDRIVLFGGTRATSDQSSVLGDTWEFNGTTMSWTQMALADPTGFFAPKPRYSYAMSYDSDRQVVVLFGGFTTPTGAKIGDTWEWTGSMWLLKAPNGIGPSARGFSAMAYDSLRQRTVLFGGDSVPGTTIKGDTWEWNGTLWMPAASSGPPPRQPYTMAPSGGTGVLLYGGRNGSINYNDTWQWNGTTWTQLTPLVGTGPGQRRFHTMSYDSARHTVVLFGGIATGVPGDTWELKAPGCVRPPSGMINWWPGDGNANDIVGGKNGTLQGNATFPDGKVGQAFSFDGNGDYVSLPADPAWNFGTGPFTIDFWEKSSNGTRMHALSFEPNYVNNRNLDFDLNDASGLWVYWNGSSAGNGIRIGSPGIYTDGLWHHIALTRSGTTMTLYVDGAAVGSRSDSSAIDLSNSSVNYIGASQTTGTTPLHFWNGLIDEVEIFNRALSANEIKGLFNADCAGKCK